MPTETAEAIDTTATNTDALTTGSSDRTALAAAAAKKALLDAGVSFDEDNEPPPANDNAKPKDKEKPANDNAEPDLKAKIMMRARQTAQKAREEAEERIAAAEERERVAQERIAEAERIKAQFEPVRGQLEKLRQKPSEAIRELGLNKQEFFDRALEEAGHAADPVKSLERKLAELDAKIAAGAEAEAKRAEEQKKAAAERASAEANEGLISTVARAPETYPWLHKRYANSTRGLLREAAEVASEYYASAHYKRTGEKITHADVAQFLENQYAALYGSESGQPPTGAATPPATGKPGPRSLSTATTSQRATVSADLKAMTPAERRERAALEAARALREHGKGSNDD